MLVIRSVFRQLTTPLAAPVQMSEQTLADMPVDLAKRLPRITVLKVVRPTFEVPIQPRNQFRDRLMALTTVRHLLQPVPLPLQRLLRRPHVQISLGAPIAVAMLAKRLSQIVPGSLSPRADRSRAS